MKSNPVLAILVLVILILSILVTSVGVFFSSGGQSFEVINQYGESVRIAGHGIYAHDSYFKAPIFRGTDWVMLFVAVPLLMLSLIMLMRSNSIRARLLVTSLLAVFTYYSASLALGVTYNKLHLAYIALFSASLFGLILAIQSMNGETIEKYIHARLPYRGFTAFLILSGVVLIIAWLPDILSSLTSGRSLALIEIYTTEITYVLDMGIIGPSALICVVLLNKRRMFGYVLLAMLLMLCAIIGLMLPVQTVFQEQAGIVLPIPVLITKVASFCLLAAFATYFLIRLFRAIKEPEHGR